MDFEVPAGLASSVSGSYSKNSAESAKKVTMKVIFMSIEKAQKAHNC